MSSSRTGMTLLELLVGLTVMGAAVSIGYGVFGAVGEQRRRATEVMEAVSRDAVIRDEVIGWLRGARLAPEDSTTFVGADRVHGHLPDDQLQFLTTAHVLPRGGDALVRLQIDRDPRTPESGLVADVQEWRGARRERIQLVRSAAGLNARYLYGHDLRHWLPGWISSATLPLGVEITLSSEHGDSLPPLFRIPLRVALGDAR